MLLKKANKIQFIGKTNGVGDFAGELIGCNQKFFCFQQSNLGKVCFRCHSVIQLEFVDEIGDGISRLFCDFGN